MAGVEGIYDQHDYARERKTALEKLAADVSRILEPQRARIPQIWLKNGRRA